jgi:hypothetical protein
MYRECVVLFVESTQGTICVQSDPAEGEPQVTEQTEGRVECKPATEEDAKAAKEALRLATHQVQTDAAVQIAQAEIDAKAVEAQVAQQKVEAEAKAAEEAQRLSQRASLDVRAH